MALPAGTCLGIYEIRELIGKGGMGEVYRARDPKLAREVALKILPPVVAADPERLLRFRREARILASLNHANIAAVYGFEESQGTLALILELVDGPTLAERIARGRMPLEEALPIATQIAHALEAAHDRAIVHRDLKPANIKIRPDGTVKVLDFGLAKTLANDVDTSESAASPTITSLAVTQIGAILGTTAYMSPEQARGNHVDARSDVWAFGCVVYEMLTATPAFGHATWTEPPAASLAREPDWALLPSNVPLSIRRMLRRCLQRDPNRRLHHIGDARIEIEDAGNAADRREIAGTTSASHRRARLLGVSTIALALALAGTLAAGLLRRPTDPVFRLAEITTPWTSDLSSFALSPDGRRIAFVADREGQPMLWIRELDSADARALPGTERARRPFWSPDSRSIGFFRDSELKRIDARGGATQTVTYLTGGTTAAWGPDGTILVSSVASPVLRRVNAAGGHVEAATTPTAASTGHRHPHFLPGGREFLFFVGGSDAVRGVYLGSLGSSQVTRLVASDTQGAYVAPGWLLFIRQGTLWARRVDLGQRTVSGEPVAVADSVAFESIDGTGAFSTSDAGVMAYRVGRPAVTRLSWFDRSGHALGTLGSPEQRGLTNFTLSPDGRRAVVELSLQNKNDLWLLDATHQMPFSRAPDGHLMRLPLWSPAGSRIAFQSIRSGSFALSAKPSTGDGAEEVLFESPEVKIPSDWSPNGKFLMYYVPNPTSGSDLWVLPQDTKVPLVFLKTEASENWGQFSPDGRWIAYQSNETGRYEIYVRPFFTPGGATPMSTAGGVYPRWSRDGNELYFIGPDANMMAVAIRRTATTVEAGVPTPLFETRRVGGGSNVIGRGHQYAVARDGRFLINVHAESTTPSIMLLMNWKP